LRSSDWKQNEDTHDKAALKTPWSVTTFYLFLLFAKGKGKSVNIFRVSFLYLIYIAQFNPLNNFVEKKINPTFPMKSYNNENIEYLMYVYYYSICFSDILQETNKVALLPGPYFTEEN
jgi:hypothetical protein